MTNAYAFKSFAVKQLTSDFPEASLERHPSMYAWVHVTALPVFPNLQRLEGIAMAGTPSENLLLLLASAQRFASCAQHWALLVTVDANLAVDVSQRAQLRSIPFVRNLFIVGYSLESSAACLSGLLAAAPYVQAVCVRFPAGYACEARHVCRLVQALQQEGAGLGAHTLDRLPRALTKLATCRCIDIRCTLSDTGRWAHRPR